jgi:hypothetical protein
MSRKFKFAALTAIVVFLAGSFAAVSLSAQALRLCCIGGQYEGFQICHAKPNCPKPLPEKFIMNITQERGCGAKIGGTITDSSGTVNHWTGTLSPGLRRCCKLEASFLTPDGDTVKFQGTFCRNRFGKWQAKGTWVEVGSTDPCKGSGTWQITQI